VKTIKLVGERLEEPDKTTTKDYRDVMRRERQQSQRVAHPEKQHKKKLRKQKKFDSTLGYPGEGWIEMAAMVIWAIYDANRFRRAWDRTWAFVYRRTNPPPPPPPPPPLPDPPPILTPIVPFRCCERVCVCDKTIDEIFDLHMVRVTPTVRMLSFTGQYCGQRMWKEWGRTCNQPTLEQLMQYHCAVVHRQYVLSGTMCFHHSDGKISVGECGSHTKGDGPGDEYEIIEYCKYGELCASSFHYHRRMGRPGAERRVNQKAAKKLFNICNLSTIACPRHIHLQGEPDPGADLARQMTNPPINGVFVDVDARAAYDRALVREDASKVCVTFTPGPVPEPAPELKGNDVFLDAELQGMFQSSRALGEELKGKTKRERRSILSSVVTRKESDFKSLVPPRVVFNEQKDGVSVRSAPAPPSPVSEYKRPPPTHCLLDIKDDDVQMLFQPPIPFPPDDPYVGMLGQVVDPVPLVLPPLLPPVFPPPAVPVVVPQPVPVLGPQPPGPNIVIPPPVAPVPPIPVALPVVPVVGLPALPVPPVLPPVPGPVILPPVFVRRDVVIFYATSPRGDSFVMSIFNALKSVVPFLHRNTEYVSNNDPLAIIQAHPNRPRWDWGCTRDGALGDGPVVNPIPHPRHQTQLLQPKEWVNSQVVQIYDQLLEWLEDTSDMRVAQLHARKIVIEDKVQTTVLQSTIMGSVMNCVHNAFQGARNHMQFKNDDVQVYLHTLMYFAQCLIRRALTQHAAVSSSVRPAFQILGHPVKQPPSSGDPSYVAP
jgi:hypothetical protein